VNRALFLDRDGTILKEIEGTTPETLGYLINVQQVELIPGSAEALIMASRLGYKNIVITNQSAIARGFITERELAAIHEKMYSLLKEDGAVIDDLFYSPFYKEGTIEKYRVESPSRKPGIGMILDAQKKHNIDLGSSWMVGDSFTDIKCGNNAGLKNILVMTGYGKIAYKKCLDENLKIDFIASNLLEAVQHIQETDARK
jgi:D-glycero-D-manno-heptose 1,7-bisphosphate phosphatase